MKNPNFRQKLVQLALSWEERRLAKGLGRQRLLGSQLELLRLIHGWARSTIEEVVAVYGAAVETAISALGGPETRLFTVDVGESRARFHVEPDPRSEGQWRTSAVVTLSGDPAGNEHGYHPREWTQRRVEEIVLQMVGAWERSRAAVRFQNPGEATN